MDDIAVMNLPVRDQFRSSETTTKSRGIKYKGGYGPPPMFTPEQHREIIRRQDLRVAIAGLNFLNETMTIEGKPEYELVAANDSAAFRTKIGRVYHGNFVAKQRDIRGATKQLFFVELKLGALEYEVIKCLDLGPVNIAAARCRQSCKFCRTFYLTDPIYHPPGFKIKHLLFDPK